MTSQWKIPVVTARYGDGVVTSPVVNRLVVKWFEIEDSRYPGNLSSFQEGELEHKTHMLHLR